MAPCGPQEAITEALTNEGLNKWIDTWTQSKQTLTYIYLIPPEVYKQSLSRTLRKYNIVKFYCWVWNKGFEFMQFSCFSLGTILAVVINDLLQKSVIIMKWCVMCMLIQTEVTDMLNKVQMPTSAVWVSSTKIELHNSHLSVDVQCNGKMCILLFKR